MRIKISELSAIGWILVAVTFAVVVLSTFPYGEWAHRVFPDSWDIAGRLIRLAKFLIGVALAIGTGLVFFWVATKLLGRVGLSILRRKT